MAKYNKHQKICLKSLRTRLNVVVIHRDDVTTALKPAYGKNFVYFLMKDGTPVYIGHTSSLYLRLRKHKQYFDFNTVWLAEYEHIFEAQAVERALIKALQPRHNTQHTKRSLAGMKSGGIDEVQRNHR